MGRIPISRKKHEKIKKIMAWIIMILLFFQGSTVVQGEDKPEQPDAPALEISAPSGILIEMSTGKVLYEKGADEERSPASITKIMTLLLIFEELEKGTLKLEDQVTTSAHAKSMGGSQVFLEEGEQQTVETLIKCIVVASGNDASVAMAEHIAGSESEFAARMNEKAKELKMEHTHFQDCCGLTQSKEHYTTAADVAAMSRELVTKFPEILDYSSIWMEDITHETRQGVKKFTLSNTNKLIRGMEGCRGLKTGSTSLAKFCVSAVAKRNNLTLCAVIMGAPDPKGRFHDASVLLNYGFGICSVYEDKNTDPLPDAVVKGGVKDHVSTMYEGCFRYVDTGGEKMGDVKKEIRMKEEIKAPVKKGQVTGEAVYTAGEKELGRVHLIAGEEVRKAGYGDCLIRAGRSFLLNDGEKAS